MIDGKLDDTKIKISHEIVERCKAVVNKDKDKKNNLEIEDLKKQMNTLTENLKSQKFNLNGIRN